MLGALLFLLFWVGHGYWLMVTLNMIYSRPYNRTFLRLIRKVWGLTLVFGPPALALIVGILANKDAGGFFAALSRSGAAVFTVPFDGAAAEPEALAAVALDVIMLQV